ncbi:MAG TPA: hypothetical protein ENK57_19860, partial [Polyangiaceae bacterium]|nr:hypothetical protein [Polyangiaceae bacterium]
MSRSFDDFLRQNGKPVETDPLRLAFADLPRPPYMPRSTLQEEDLQHAFAEFGLRSCSPSPVLDAPLRILLLDAPTDATLRGLAKAAADLDTGVSLPVRKAGEAIQFAVVYRNSFPEGFTNPTHKALGRHDWVKAACRHCGAKHVGLVKRRTQAGEGRRDYVGLCQRCQRTPIEFGSGSWAGKLRLYLQGRVPWLTRWRHR